jgi:hypothetical protein
MTHDEHSRAIATDLDDVRKQWFNAGFKAGAESERARIQAVQEQTMPGHETLVEIMKFDGKTTGEQAAVQILAAREETAESHRRRSEGGRRHGPFELSSRGHREQRAQDRFHDDPGAG